MQKTVAVLISGGVDSSVSLYLLKDQGYKIKAFYLKIWLEDELSYLSECPWEDDLDYVKRTCSMLDIDLEIISMQKEYWDTVVKYTIDSIKNGNTPNPDIFCNRDVKLGAFINKYGKDFDYVATGHYAKRLIKDEKIYLSHTNDLIKDQTYFLAYTPYEAIKKTLFPIGDLKKADVRIIAKENNLPAYLRPDSQGICFLGNIKFKEFVKYHLGIKNGHIICYDTGKKLGIHEGYWFYTIGQRQGLGLAGGPWYVVDKNIDNNIIYVSKISNNLRKDDNDKISIRGINWLVDIFDRPIEKENVFVKLRHGPNFYDSKILKIDNNYLELEIEGKDQGIATGQFAVFYNKEKICLGGGEMKKK